MLEKQEQRVIVVSNRLPVSLKRSGNNWQTKSSAGGLATAMNPILQKTNGIWIGWSGETSGSKDESRLAVIRDWAKKNRYSAVDLDRETAEGFYEGIANQVLWPLFHHFPSLLHFDSGNWNSYLKANEIFRDEILKHLQPNDLVWIHDYHFLPLPQMLREAVPDIAIGFFLHVPFPSSSVFRILPKREELLQGMLGSDYLGFHTYRYLQHFRTSILRLLGLKSQMDQVELGRRIVKLDALPIGIAPDEFNDLLVKSPGTKRQIAELKQRFSCCKLILGVDRMDYTKGIPERLRAYRKFLQDAPEWRGRVVLIQVAVPSREGVPKYNRLRKEVDELIGQINGDWSTPNWSPITYVRRNLPQSELAALYSAADVALVTPLRDGLNLVAKEYVACKSSGDGVLILSEFAGAASEMGEALLVNPYDEEGLSLAIGRALSLSDTERRERMLALYRRVNKNNVFAWGERFVQNLSKAVKTRSQQSQDEPLPLQEPQLLAAFSQAHSRLILLDYDGTLAPFSDLPREAVPTSRLIALLTRLTEDRRSLVALVSGRSRPDLERWFGGIPNLWLAAEHGAVVRSPVSQVWEQPHQSPNTHWKLRVLPILEHFVERTPGSFIEEKEFSLVWHYRMADLEFGDWLANDLVANLDHMLANSLVKAVKGQKTVEVKLVWANKGQMYSRLLVPNHKPDFIMAAGDDATDEDLFAQLPQSAWTIHVGRNRSRARYYVSDPKEMLAMLERLNQAAHATENRGAHDVKYWQEERSGEIELLEGMSEQKESTQSQRVTAGEIFT
jgi:trehalose 6-phosphate synthase/phosphatase